MLKRLNGLVHQGVGVIRRGLRIPQQCQGGAQERIGGRRRAALDQCVAQGLRPAQVTPDLKGQSLRARTLRRVQGLQRCGAGLPALNG